MSMDELVRLAQSTGNNALSKIKWDDFAPVLSSVVGEDDAKVIVRILKKHGVLRIEGFDHEALDKLGTAPVVPIPPVVEVEAIYSLPAVEEPTYGGK